MEEDENPGININESLVKTCILRFKHLRLLNLRCSKLEALSSSIGTLKHLRYLNLCGNTNIKKLPNSICNLQNLETLILFGCHGLEELPRDIRKMVSLRHFVITTKQTRLPANGIECMFSLRLLLFYACEGLERFHEGIQRLTALRSLDFRCCYSLISLPQGDDYPTRLRELGVAGLGQLVSLPQWLKGSANTLQFLHISFCENLEVLPEWLPDLSSLRQLKIWGCPKLSSLPEGMDRLTALRELQIGHCPELRRNCEQEVGKDWGKMVKFTFRDVIRRLFSQKRMFFVLKIATAEFSEFECDELFDDITATKKDTALCLALSRLASDFGRESVLSLQQFFSSRHAPVISTGSLKLDIPLGVGGLPRLMLSLPHRIVLVVGYCACLDVENAMDPSLVESMGINTENLLISCPISAENLLSVVNTLTRSGVVDVIVVDSVRLGPKSGQGFGLVDEVTCVTYIPGIWPWGLHPSVEK
ncbi:dna repair protein reca like protein 2 [Quercus suber]|uniref:Dna repair protein reca like protein 2 n=1 Tax=Quercus suber TaxID=58331 RepID=A0AAW0L1F3_QUESU